MGYSVKPFVGCNLGCEYCYEAGIRHAGNARKQYNLEAIKQRIIQVWNSEGQTPTMHGGEFLLLPKPDAEELFRLCYELSGQNGIQTNGTLIDDEWIEMFKKYNVTVGVSIDGPGPLNRARWAGSVEKTDAMTERVMENIRKMRRAGVHVGIIVVLNRLHVETPNAMEMMKKWMLELRDIGVTGGRLNAVQVDDPALAAKYELTPEELAYIYRELGTFVLTTPGLHWQPFRDIQDALLGLSLGTCVYQKCDVLATNAERAIRGDGTIGNCLKTAKDGVDYLRAEDGEQHHRYELLAQTPREYGGCKGCRYWRICYGHCPTEGIDGDFRNRSRYCEAYYATYETVEKLMKAMFPNLRTICDYPDLPDGYEERVSGNYPFDGLALMHKGGTRSPSVFRGNAWSNALRQDNPFLYGYSQSRQCVTPRHPEVNKAMWEKVVRK